MALERNANGALAWLQSWFLRQCNGAWEYEHGIRIQTDDYPGWIVVIHFGQTDLSDATFDPIEIDLGDDDWMNCAVQRNAYYGSGYPSKLEAILDEFRRWASSQPAKQIR